MSFGGKQKVEQTNKTVLTPEQEELQKKAMTNINANLTPEGTPNFSLPGVPDFDPAQTAAQNSVLQKTGPGGQLSGAVNTMAGANDFILGGDAMDVNKNPYLQNAISAAMRPITENFQSTVIPGLRTEAISAGGLGDTKNQQAGQLAADRYLRQVGDTSSSMANTAYQSGLDARTKALALAPATNQALLFPEAAAEGVGAQRRGLVEAQGANQLANKTLPMSIGMQLLNAASGAPGGGSQSQVTPATGGGWTQALGAGASAISALLGFL